MSTADQQLIDTGIGNRHRIWRTEIMGFKSQGAVKVAIDAVEGVMNRSQSSISNYDNGQVPSADYLMWMARTGLNLHWYFTGKGPREVKMIIEAREPGMGYDVLRKTLDLNTSNAPIMVLRRKTNSLADTWLDIKRDESLSDEDVRLLQSHIDDKLEIAHVEYKNEGGAAG